MLAAPDYPARSDYRGAQISGVEEAEATGALVFHAGTALHDGQLVTNGGRILNVVGLGETVAAARTAAYDAVSCIDFAGMQFRTGHRRQCLTRPLVGILVGSESDRERMEGATKTLDEAGIAYEFEVRSAHRTPDSVAEYAKTARERGLKVLICGAGLAAALPGAVAAHTDLPVIGVPLRSSLSVLDGLDALLAIAQMPPGVPVAAVGVDNAKNAAALAIRILNV